MADPAGGYQVALPGSFGPAFLAAFADVGVRRTTTASVLFVSLPDNLGIKDVTAMLEERGVTVLAIRRMTGFTHQG
jgi:hypothetical protein